MSGKKIDLGPTGEHARDRIQQLREDQRLSYAELSRRLEELQRPIPPLGLRRIEDGTRRVDVDDLTAIAVALGVSPITLLTPDATEAGESVVATGVHRDLTAEELWKWLRAEGPISGAELDGAARIAFMGAAVPAWRSREWGQGAMALIELRRLELEIEAGGGRDVGRRLAELAEAVGRKDLAVLAYELNDEPLNEARGVLLGGSNDGDR